MGRLSVSVVFFVFIQYLCRSSFGYDEASVEEEGYFRRDHSLIQPYHGTGMDVPYWKFGGSTVVSSNYVRLTPDRQSKKGIIWNTVPVYMHNWEVVLHFEVHGQGKNLFGDGFAFWYAKELGELGPVFGSRDYFAGLAVFFDTYSNHNGEHSHDHPYISAMVNNGSIHYDHDRDGTHSQVSGCTCYFRNSREDTSVAITYNKRELAIFTNIDGTSEWKSCFTTKDVDLPTGFHFGVSATTGDLADNHDVISMRVYDLDDMPDEDATADSEEDWSTVVPRAGMAEPARAHIEDSPPFLSPGIYKAISFLLLVLLVVGIVAAILFIRTKDKGQKRYF